MFDCCRDASEMSHQVADLQFQNRRLMEKNLTLRSQLDGAEELSTNMTVQIDGLQKKLRV